MADKPITITEFTGQAENPHIGAGVAVGVDLYTTKNVARLSRKMLKKTGNLITDFPLYITQGVTNDTIPSQIEYAFFFITPPLQIGETITGLTSGATATIVTLINYPFMTVTGVTGVFLTGETFIGATSGGQGSILDYTPAIVTGNNPIIFVQDDDGNVYQSIDDGDNWTLVPGNSGDAGTGIMVWENYLFSATPDDIDIYGPLGGTPTWTNGWWTSVTGANQPALLNSVRTNHVMFINPALNFLYIDNGRYIAYVQLSGPAVTFDPANQTTFIADEQAFIMPDYYVAQTMAFMPPNQTAIAVENRLNNSSADVVFWDGTTNTTASNVVSLAGATGAVRQLLTRNGVLYGITNYEHGIYTINGSSAKLVDRLTLRMSNRTAGGSQDTKRISSYIYPHGADFLGPELLTAGSNTFQFVTHPNNTGLYPYGIWSANIENSVVGLRFPLSFNVINALYSTSYEIGFVKVVDEAAVLVGWGQGNTFGIDKLSASDYITNAATTFVESSLYEVGTRTLPRTFDELEFNLIQPLLTGEVMTWYWRKSLADDYQPFQTKNTVTMTGALSGIISPLPFGSVQYIQIGFTMNSDTGTPTNTPQVRSMILR